MSLHPAIENLIKLVNNEKNECSKENLNKWCAGLPKDERDFFLPKVKTGNTTNSRQAVNVEKAKTSEIAIH